MAPEIKVLRQGDEAVLAAVAPEVFDYPIDPAFTQEFLADPRLHIAVAIVEGQVVGFASGVHYLHPDKPPELWINEVGVAPTHRRLGLGRAVVLALFDVAKSLRCKVAWVLTDRKNTAAIALYASVGGVQGEEGLSDEIVGYAFRLAP